MASVFSKLLAGAAQSLDGRFGWHRLPRPLGVLTLIGLRARLRERNLYDTGLSGAPAPEGRTLSARTLDGTSNDLEEPLMGSIGSRFGRNFHSLRPGLSRSRASSSPTRAR
jgi:hypothetical protein